MKEAKEYVRKLGIICLKDKDKEEPVEEKENVQEKVIVSWEINIFSTSVCHWYIILDVQFKVFAVLDEVNSGIMGWNTAYSMDVFVQFWSLLIIPLIW